MAWWDTLGQFAQGVGGGAKDGAVSMGEGIADLAKGGYSLATDQGARDAAWNAVQQGGDALVDYGGRAVQNPGMVWNDAANGVNSMRTAFDKAHVAAVANGTEAQFWGNMTGRGAFEVAAAVVPVGAATKAGKLATMSKGLAGVDKAADISRASRLPVGCASCAAKQATGTALQTYWPPNRGFAGAPTTKTLLPGMVIDRYGYDGGTFLAPKGVPDWMRSLEPGTTSKPYKVYEVVERIDVQAGPAAPWFGQLGGGTQYELPMTVKEAVDKKLLRVLGP